MLLLKWIKNKNDDDGVRGEIFQVKNTSNEIHCARSDRYMGGGGGELGGTDVGADV